MCRVYHKDQNGTGNRSKIRTKERNNIRYTHDYTDQSCIRSLQYSGSDKAETSNNKGIYDFTANESDKGIVSKAKTSDQTVGGLLLKESICHFLCLSGKLFLACQNINRNNKSYNEIPQTFQNIYQSEK